MVPEYTTEMRDVTRTVYRYQPQEKQVTVYKNVPITEEKTINYTVMVPQTQTRTVSFTVCKPVMETQTREYTVNVPSAGSYTPQIRVANSATGGSFHFEFYALDASGNQSATPYRTTGAWDEAIFRAWVRTFTSSGSPVERCTVMGRVSPGRTGSSR